MVLYPMHEMLAHIESRYLLVNMVAHRARRDLRRGGEGAGVSV